MRLAADPWEFLTTQVKLNDPPPSGKGIIPFQPWSHLLELLKALETHPLVQVLKARQIGITWLLAGYALHKAMFNEGANVLILSKGEEEASEVLARCKLIHRELPDHLRLSLGANMATRMTFPVMDSKIMALPATKDAGRTETATLVICDEWDYHPYADDNYAAIKPTIDAGGQFIGVSTVDKMRQDSFFKQLWRLGGSSGFYQLFLSWEQRPGRDKVWYDQTKRSYPNLLKWEAEYPSTVEEALSPSEEQCFFDIDKLKNLMENAKEGDTFKLYVVGRRYAAWIDPAGMGEDSHSLSVLDCQTGEFVVDFTNKEPIGEFALRSKGILARYQLPLLGIESNGVGLAMLEAFKGLDYPTYRLVYQDEKRTKLGVPMTSSLRERVLVNLAEGIRQGSLIVYSRPALEELFSFVKKDKGAPRATEGAHDDRVMAMAGANWVAGQMPRLPVGAETQRQVLSYGRA